MPTPIPTSVPTQTSVLPSTIPSPFPAATEPDRYRRLDAPLLPRTESDQTTLLKDLVGFQTGSYRPEYTGERFLIYPQDGDVPLALTLPGAEALNALAAGPTIETRETKLGDRLY